MRVLAALAVLVAVEVTVLYLVGSQVGFLGLVGVLLGAALLGAWAIGHEGRRSMRALVEAARSGRPAEAEVADGMLVALAGVLLVLPGLITDVAALALLVPPVRRALARRTVASARRRTPTVTVMTSAGPRSFGAAGAAPPAGRGPAPGGPVVEGRVLDSEIVDDPRTGRRSGPGTPGTGASSGAA